MSAAEADAVSDAGGRRQVELQVGRRAYDAVIVLSAHLPQVLSLRVVYGNERAPTVVLTREQVRGLRRALAEMEQLIEPEAAPEGPWGGGERRGPTG